MSELEESTPTKIVKRPEFTKLVGETLRVPSFEDDDYTGQVRYYLHFVTPEGKAEKIECTKGVYQDVEKEQLYKNYRLQYHLLLDQTQELVTHINVKTKREFLPPGFSPSDIVGGEKEAQFLEVSLTPESELQVLRSPTTVASTTENEVLTSLGKDSQVSSGDYIEGKYRVSEIRERDGYKTFFIDTHVMDK